MRSLKTRPNSRPPMDHGPSTLRVLVLYSEHDKTQDIKAKIIEFNDRAGPFAAIIIVGEVSYQDLKFDPQLELPLYVVTTEHYEHDTEVKELCDVGVLKLSNGLIIGYLDACTESDHESIVKQFGKVAQQVDILLIKNWNMQLDTCNAKTVLVDTVISISKPHYMITYGKAIEFSEADPFSWNNTLRITRSINLASIGSGKKWAYAFNIEPNATTNLNRLQKTSPNPYETMNKRSHCSMEFDGKTSENIIVSELPQKETKKLRTILPGNCHFCFSNPELEDHMVISIRDAAYLTTAKGPLTVPTGDMNFSGHCLIIPVDHIPKVVETNENEKLSNEIKEYEESIVRMNYISFNASTIIYEIQSSRSIHYHKQVVPIPTYLILKFQRALDRQVHLNNEKYRGNHPMKFEMFDTKSDALQKLKSNPDANYVQFTVYETSNADPKIYIAQFPVESRIDLQFGRRTLAFMLNLPKRIKWDSAVCLQDRKEESEEVDKFQRAYKKYDPAVPSQ